MEIYLKVIKENYVNFNGRARRKEFWIFQLFLIIISTICFVLDNILGTVITIDAGPAGLISSPYGWLYFLCGIFHFLPSLSVLVRRLHDVGKSGWWQLIAFTIVGLIPLIIWLATEGTKKNNSHGKSIKLKK